MGLLFLLYKVHGKACLCLIKHHSMKMYWDVAVYLSALQGSDQPHATAALSKKKREPGTHFIEAWVDPDITLEAAVSASINNQTLTLWLLSRSLVTILTELSLLHNTEFFL
jgi:hypothetical protein